MSRWAPELVEINCVCVFACCSHSQCLGPVLNCPSNPNSTISLTPSLCQTQTHIGPLLGPSCECATCNDREGHLPVPALLRPFFAHFLLLISLQSSILTHFLRSSSPGPAEPLIPHSVLLPPQHVSPRTHGFWSDISRIFFICYIYIKTDIVISMTVSSVLMKTSESLNTVILYLSNCYFMMQVTQWSIRMVCIGSWVAAASTSSKVVVIRSVPWRWSGTCWLIHISLVRMLWHFRWTGTKFPFFWFMWFCRCGCNRGPRCYLGTESHSSGATEERAEYDPDGTKELGKVLWPLV